MNIFQKHEIFEMDVLQKLQSHRLLEQVVFGGGTMLRLCHDLKRYSADLDFWLIKEVMPEEFFETMQRVLEKKYEITDGWLKHHSILFEIRSSAFPRRLKIEIRKGRNICDFIETIAFSQYCNTQVLLKTHTLEQTMQNKIEALLNRKAIRDGFDLEFLLRRGVPLPKLTEKQRKKLVSVIRGFTSKDFKVTLGSVLENDIRKYYTENGFMYLKEKLSASGF